MSKIDVASKERVRKLKHPSRLTALKALLKEREKTEGHDATGFHSLF